MIVYAMRETALDNLNLDYLLVWKNKTKNKVTAVLCKWYLGEKKE